jgi:hypothetical protein
MLKPSPLSGFMKITCLVVLLFTFHSIVLSQTIVFKGNVKDEQTLKPVADVNIMVNGATSGTSTDGAGNFSLKIDKIPAIIRFTCVGYEVASYAITGVPKAPIEFQLRPKTYSLPEVDISSKKYSYLFKDQDYSVLDYEIMGENLVLIIYRYQLKQSELVLLARNGDTLSFSPLPEVPPSKLFKDFLANVHYISKDQNAFQFRYNGQFGRIEFYRGITVDSLKASLKQYIFKLWGRWYFQEKLANGFGTAIGFHDQKTGKHYIRTFINENKLARYSDDQAFYGRWNYHMFLSDSTEKSLLPRPDEFYTTPEFDFGSGELRGWMVDNNETRAHQVEFYKMIFPVVKTPDDLIAFFNFATDTIELMNGNGKIISTVPISFHKAVKAKTGSRNVIRLSDSEWRWGSQVLTDEYSREVYTVFLKNGMVKIQKVDLETGILKSGTVLPFPFPEKIEIYKGDAYFLVKSDGSNDKWKLVKCKID